MPQMACVFAVFLVTGAALPALPLHIHDDLGFSPFTVGVVAGAQFVSALLCRLWSGSVSDRCGPKFTVTVGLVMVALAGALYLVSLIPGLTPRLSITILVLGRVVLGGAESFTMIGAQSWCLALASTGNVGKMIAWIGTAMFVALAVGTPLGSLLFSEFGFVSIGLATSLAACLLLPLIFAMSAVTPEPLRLPSVRRVFKSVWVPGIGMAFASVGYGIMTTFAVLLFVQRGWTPAWLSFTAFALALIAARVLFGALPDRLGGARTAVIFIVVHSLGLALTWFTSQAWLGFAGAAIAGFGYALVYPGLGMEAVSRAPPEGRGLAMGIYTAFIDLALGVLAPLLGLVATRWNVGIVFLMAALLALCAVPIAIWLRINPPPAGMA